MFLIMLAAVSLDCAVLPKMEIFGIKPSLTLCVLVCIVAVYGKFSGALAGLAIGALLDVLFAPARGFYSLQNMLTGYIAGVVFEKGMRDDSFLIGILAFGMYLVREVIGAILAAFLGVKIGNFIFLFIRYLLPSAVLTGLVCIPLFMLLRSFMTTGYMKRRRVGLD